MGPPVPQRRPARRKVSRHFLTCAAYFSARRHPIKRRSGCSCWFQMLVTSQQGASCCRVPAHPQVSVVTKGVKGEAWELLLIQENMIWCDPPPDPAPQFHCFLFGPQSSG